MQIVFFSLDLVGNKATSNRIRMVKQDLNARGIKTQLVIGSYNGQIETSFKCQVENESQLKFIQHIAKFSKQESILIVDENSHAMLQFVSTRQIKYIGKFTKVTKNEVQELQAWTYIPHTDEHFTCIGA